ncbi:MAG: hypothetical protein ABSE16_13190 [Verrucomicrobiota bacterium]|jgi:hypothetical protein
MKRWAILTVLLYATALILLTIPVLLVAFGSWAVGGWSENGAGMSLADALQVYRHWFYWLWLAVLVAGQALLLLLPIHRAERRLPARRSLQAPVFVSAFFLAILTFAGLLAVFCAAFKEEGFGMFGFLTPFRTVEVYPSDLQTTVGMLITVLVFWFIWGVIFHKFARADDPDARLKHAVRWLLRGSILELIVAVPSHVIVRQRNDCCAPAGTFWGIATGISVMLLCLGPGVFFLFVERFQRLKPKRSPAETQSA